MSDVVISVENLTKEYRLGTINHGTLTRDLQSWWARLRGKEDPNSIVSSVHSSPSAGNPHFLALNNVSFEVKRRETLGIIGRNGAGKSTLLKILSRVTAPSKGLVKIKGRVASLLEVGTGFHPELTGRENIFLNGAILGMTKAEIRIKFDEIVAFAEIEKFLETPVKRYSSGMYVRLAFAVAAHLEPEILIVDEVLSVGDALFQKKCLGKMQEVGNEGRTVLFVSHNMGAIKQLCSRSVLLEKGSIIKTGLTKQVCDYYLGEQLINSAAEHSWGDREGPGDHTLRLTRIRLCSESGEVCAEFGTDDAIYLEIYYQVFERQPFFRMGFSLHSTDGTYIFYSADDDRPEYAGQSREVGKYSSRCRIPSNWLNVGSYYLSISGGLFGIRQVIKDIPVLAFTVIPTGGPTSRYDGRRQGVFAPALDWEIRHE